MGERQWETLDKGSDLQWETLDRPAQPTEFEREAVATAGIGAPEQMAGSPVTRYAVGAASPILGTAQLGAESVGYEGVSRGLNAFEQLKRKGMEPAAQLGQLELSRAKLSKLPGYEGQIALIDKQIAEARGKLGKPSDETDVAGFMGFMTSPLMLKLGKMPAGKNMLDQVIRSTGGATVAGASMPVTGTDDYFGVKTAQTATAAALGALVPPGVAAAQWGWRLGNKLFDMIRPGGYKAQAARLLQKAAESRRAAIEKSLATEGELVKGSKPTAAVAATKAESAEFAGLEKVVERQDPSAYHGITKAGEEARVAAIRQIGGTADDLAAATTARNVEAARNYATASAEVVSSDGALKMLLKRPSMKKALSRAKQIAKEQGERFLLGNKISVGNLHNVKTAMDDMVKNPEQFGIGASEVQAIRGTKTLFMDWLETKAPAYKTAREAYAAASKPINRMQVGQELEKALTKPVGEGERATVFAGAIREAPRTIKRATGQSRYDDISDVLRPQDIEVVENVLKDLERNASYERLSRFGASKAHEIVMPWMLPATGPLHQQYMIFKTILGRISMRLNKKAIEHLTQVLKVPEETLNLLRTTTGAEKQKLMDLILRQRLGIASGTVAGKAIGEGVITAEQQ